MEKTKSRVKAPANRSSHVIDLRKSGGSSAAQKKPSRVRVEPEESVEVPAARIGRPQAAPLSPELETPSSEQAAPLDPEEAKADVSAVTAVPDDAELPEGEPIQPPARSNTAQPEPTAAAKALTPPRGAVADDIAPHHRFWPAFWRFIVLVAVFSALVVGGTYLYLHYHSF